ncbi:hypothetical protein Aglo03_11210 [Actinokineospora globicatena]|uniref:Uncharacterized protein n=1 Tax=Actinokineospora globicatena TaxID=103729 RepID=A0A9W6V5G0_9PSEU|nr:hypothetical protein Aglo03_11210 [Actinokineospora globicatena]
MGVVALGGQQIIANTRTRNTTNRRKRNFVGKSYGYTIRDSQNRIHEYWITSQANLDGRPPSQVPACMKKGGSACGYTKARPFGTRRRARMGEIEGRRGRRGRHDREPRGRHSTRPPPERLRLTRRLGLSHHHGRDRQAQRLSGSSTRASG